MPRQRRPILATLEGVEILKTLLEADPSVPRLTCYDETTRGRTDLSAQTLDNWASKIANMLHDEFDLVAGDQVWIDLPLIWQSPCIILGCERAGVTVSDEEPLVVFTTVSNVSTWEEKFPDAYIAVLTDDPFGRGVVECGDDIPPGVIDFGPEVRFHPDAYLGAGPDSDQTPVIGEKSAANLLSSAGDYADEMQLTPGSRIVSDGWLEPDSSQVSADKWARNVLSAWVRGGAAVVVRGGDNERVAAISTAEKARVI